MSSIGIEVELLLSLREADESDLEIEDFASWLSEIHNAATQSGIRMYADIGGAKADSDDGKKWMVTDDPSLEVNTRINQWALEFVSPILRYEDGSWRPELEQLYETLNRTCIIEVNRTCGTHVHISLGKGLPWPIEDLGKIAGATLYYERAWNALLPLNRRCNFFSKSNHIDNPKLADMTLLDCLRTVRACETPLAIAQIMNNNDDRYFNWNFTNLAPSKSGTIECRRAPRAPTFEDCQAWVELVLLFIQACRKAKSFGDACKCPPNVEGLKKFVYEMSASEEEASNALGLLFEGKSGTIASIPIGELRLDEVEKLRLKKEKDEKKSLKLKKAFASARQHYAINGSYELQDISCESNCSQSFHLDV